jgi:hypothetical protein
VTHLLNFVTIFPYDSTIDSVMGYHHLVIAYSLTWFIHLCYLGYVIHKRRSARSLDGK